MSKKRRTFDIDLPDTGEDKTFPAGKVSEKERRGPMATAISENAESLKERQELEARIRTENDELAHEHVKLRNLGLVVQRLPFDKINVDKITRDRTHALDEELPQLVESIRTLGLSNPIQVEETLDGEFELIQGYRRISAFKQLLEETGDEEAYGTIPARVMPLGDNLETLHRRMVDENLVRKAVSFAEMAQLAISYAADPGTNVTIPEKAVKVLFASANYSKRSYIRNFIKVVETIGEDLQYPHHIPRALGIKIATVLEEIEESAGAIRRRLKELGEVRTVSEELKILKYYAALVDTDAIAKSAEENQPKKKTATAVEGKAKVTFQIKRPEGLAKCTAGAGRIELRLDRDFSTIDRRELQDAVMAFLDRLG